MDGGTNKISFLKEKFYSRTPSRRSRRSGIKKPTISVVPEEPAGTEEKVEGGWEQRGEGIFSLRTMISVFCICQLDLYPEIYFIPKLRKLKRLPLSLS